MKIICCACLRVKAPDGWREELPMPGESVSHGFCPECGAKFMARIEERYGMGLNRLDVARPPQ